MEQEQKTETLAYPLTLVIFGVTGDLAYKKLIPALWDLFENGVYTKELLHIIGLSRMEQSDEQFRFFVKKSVLEKYPQCEEGVLVSFLSCFVYESGFFEEDASYEKMKQRIRTRDEEIQACSSKLVYLAVPPEFYKEIFQKIHHSQLLLTCANAESQLGRILVEKPFGKDATMARQLDEQLGGLFHESQIFRIDHYLAKETIQNILNFRFANHIFEPLWNKDHIESVEIRLAEDFGIETRGSFYDGVGALRDVGQNHILQMLAVVAMESPKTFSAQEIRKNRYEILRAVSPWCHERSHKHDTTCCLDTIRGQYKGYQEEEGVQPQSETETYFRIKAQVKTPTWKGVPFILESGKHLDRTETSIRIHFKKASLASLCPRDNKDACGNTLIFHIKPEEGISLSFWTKRPGFSKELECHTLHFRYGEMDGFVRIPDAYEHVLFEAMKGDQTLFASTDEVRAQWDFITAIMEHWDDMELKKYERGIHSVE